MKNINDLRSFSLKHRVAAPENAWMRLESKLENARDKRKISKFKYVSVAAVMFAVAAVTALLLSQRDLISTPADSSEMYSLQILESDQLLSPGIYEIDKLRTLKSRYNGLSSNTKM